MNKKWHDNVFFGLHFDLHAAESDTELGKNLTAGQLVEQLSKIKPDFVQCDCKGHPGYTSYPTKVGTPAPGIIKDNVRIWAEAAGRLGIPIVMHYSGVFDNSAIKKHPEWGRVNSFKSNKCAVPSGEIDDYRDENMTCPLSDYTDDYMIPQMLEIVDLYDVDGFWVDGECWACKPCYCERCKSLFIQKTGRIDIPKEKGDDGWNEWLQFNRSNFEDHVRRYTEAIHKRKPECTVCSNWMYTVRQPDDITVPVDYLSGDFDWAWSTARASAEARFMDSRGLGWDLMAWGFTSYGPMKDWVFKTVPALCQEAAVVMSCGGAFMIYDIPDRSGPVVDWHMDEIAEVARFCRARQEYCQNTRSVPQVAIMHAGEHFYANNPPLYDLGRGSEQIEGALHVLLENNLHIDILSGTDIMRKVASYPLCIVAEQDNLTNESVDMLKRYVYEGGALIVSGNAQTQRFDDILGVEDMNTVVGKKEQEFTSIPDGKKTVPAIGQWRLVKTAGATEVEPLLLSRDMGSRMQKSGSPAATVNRYGKGTVAGIYGPVFGTYAVSHYPGIRRFINKIITSMKIEGLMKVVAPARVNITLREKGRRLLVNLVNMGCDQPLSPRNTIVENVPPAGPIKLSLTLPDKPEAVYMVPSFMPVEWIYADGLFKAEINEIGIHDILVIEQ